MVWMQCFVLLLATFVVAVISEGISHSSHMMLKAAENGDTNTVIDYIKRTGVPINVKNNYGVR
jgi:amino acid permease